MRGLKPSAKRDDDERDGEGQQEFAERMVRQQSGDKESDADRAEAPEEIDEGKRGAGALVVAAAGEDVGGGDQLPEADSRNEEGDGAGEEAAGVGKCAQAGAGGEQAEEDPVAQLVGDSGAADEGAEELCEEQQAGLVVGEVPLLRKGRKDGAEQDGAHAREQEPYTEPEYGWAGGRLRGGGRRVLWRTQGTLLRDKTRCGVARGRYRASGEASFKPAVAAALGRLCSRNS